MTRFGLGLGVALAALAGCHGAEQVGLSDVQHPIVGAWTTNERPGRIFFHPSHSLDDHEVGLASLVGKDAGATYDWDASSLEGLEITFVDRDGAVPALQVTTAFSDDRSQVELGLPDGGGSLKLTRAPYSICGPGDCP